MLSKSTSLNAMQIEMSISINSVNSVNSANSATSMSDGILDKEVIPLIFPCLEKAINRLCNSCK